MVHAFREGLLICDKSSQKFEILINAMISANSSLKGFAQMAYHLKRDPLMGKKWQFDTGRYWVVIVTNYKLLRPLSKFHFGFLTLVTNC